MSKILIVDDSPAQAGFMRAALQQAGYAPVTISDPCQVEATIARERPQLILLDVVMPTRNGFQVCRDIKAHAEYGRIPILLVTSKDSESDRYWARQQGADGFVAKPFTSEQLLTQVQTFLRG